MAELTAARNNALPYPVYGAPWVVNFPILDADGDPVTGATLDSEISKNNDTGVDCTNEGVEIVFTTATNKGQYYLILTAAEMTADIVTVNIYPDSGKATVIVLYPRKLVTLASGTSAGGAVGYITLAASTVDFDDQFNGCLCVATIDSNVEARVLQACTTADQQCTVTPNWNVAPDADDTYIVYLPEGMQVPQADVRAWLGTLVKADTAGYPTATVKDGTGTGELDTTSGRVLSDLVYVHGSALTETAGQLAAGFVKWFDVAAPTGTLLSIPDALAGAAGGLATSDQVDGIGTAGGAALSQDVGDDNYDGGISGVTSGTTKTGTQTATYAATSVADGIAHIMTHDGQVVGIVYQFQAGGGTSPVTIEWLGLLNPINDTLTLQVWNHVGGAWETLGTRDGQTSTTAFTPKTLILYARHMGTSVAELGNVYLQLLSSEAYNHIVRTDQVYLTYAVTSRTVGYVDGAIWVDSAGTAGSVDYVNGTADNPCPYANAKAISTSLGLNRFHIANGNTLTLDADSTNKTFVGDEWALVLGTQTVTGAYFRGASVTGTGNGTSATFEDCQFQDSASIPAGLYYQCGVAATSGTPMTGSTAGEYVLKDCYSMVAGSGTPYMAFSGLGSASGVNIRGWLGGSHTTLDSDNTLSLEVLKGGGQTVVTGGADVEIRADCRAITVTATAAETIQIIANTGPITLGDDGASTATINVYGQGMVTDNTNGATVTDYTDKGASGGVTLYDGAHGGSSAVLTLKNAVISGGAIGLAVNGTTAGVQFTGGTTGIGLDINGGSSSGIAVDIDTTSGIGIAVNSADTDAVQFSAGGNGIGLDIIGSGSGEGMSVTGGMTGAGLALYSGPAGIGSGFSLIGPNDADIDITGDITGNLAGTIDGLTAAGLATLFTIDSTKTYALAVAGSPVKEIADNATVTAPHVLISTTIATLASQVSFTLTAGSADDNAYSDPPCMVVITDQSTGTQKAVGYASAYTGATKTVTLGQDPGIFTFVPGDLIAIVATHPHIDAAISSVASNTGAGAIEWEVLVEDSSSNPLDGAEVWFTSDEAGSNTVGGTLTTNALGKATFMIDAGTYYFWKQLGGYNFTNPESVVVS